MIEKIFIAMVAGLFGVLPALFQWISARNKAKSKEHNLYKLSNELEFLERLLKLTQECGTEIDNKKKNENSKSIQAEAERIFFQYKILQNQESVAATMPPKISLFRRSTLLFQPQSMSGWIVHSVFYMLVIFTIAILLSEIGEDGYSDLLLGMIIIMGPIFLILQKISSYIRKKETSDV